MINSVLPNSWLMTSLGEVIDYGKTVKVEPTEVSDETWVLELEDIEKESSTILQRLTFAERKSKSTKNRFVSGDVLYGKLRPYLNKVVVADSDGICSTEIVPLKASENLDNRYLFYWVKHPKFLAYVTEVGYGVNMPRLGTKDGKAAPFVLAPLAEQKQIAAKLDELLAQVDSLKTRLDAIPDILKRFRQSVLAAAVSGRLTEDWREINSDTTQVHPREILDNKRLAVDSQHYTFDIPGTWTWVNFGSQVKLINGDRGKNYPNKAEYVSNGIPFINTGHIDPNGTLSMERMNFITREKFDSLGSGKVAEGDLVYCLRGATMGKTAIVDPIVEGAIASSLVIVRVTSNLVNKFAYLYLVSPQGKDLITKFDNGSAQPNLSAKSVSLYPLALPSIDEQTEIVRQVGQLFTFADQVEKRIRAAQFRVNNLIQSILAKAFRGELTADWREQNPELISGENSAESLLEQIKAERNEAKKNKKPTRRTVKKKSSKPMRKHIVPTKEALEEANKPLTSQQLLAEAGYPNDASVEQIEAFFLDIREQISLGLINRERRGDDDYLSLVE